MNNPYLITGPARISFSGGRTSAYMLHQILQAHGGTLPDDVVVAFANTGKEREETLRFVHECSSRWGVKVHWLEWRPRKPWFKEVDFASASRNGEPFAELIASKQRPPNWQARYCTQKLKIETMNAFMTSLGYGSGEYAEVIGLRYDEGPRVLKMLGQNEAREIKAVAPLAKAKVTKLGHVLPFWRAQDFDLELADGEGNCDLCFLKGKGLRLALMAANPGMSSWWADQESRTDGFFDRRTRYADLQRQVDESPEIPGLDDAEEYDTECGLTCAGEAA